jgi:hypothetical protein
MPRKQGGARPALRRYLGSACRIRNRIAGGFSAQVAKQRFMVFVYGPFYSDSPSRGRFKGKVPC